LGGGCSFSPPWKSIYGAEGTERARRRRTKNHATTPAITATPTTPPTTPPAIALAFELVCEVGVEVDVDDEPDTDALDVDWAAVLVEVGTREAVPVTSGESR